MQKMSKQNLKIKAKCQEHSEEVEIIEARHFSWSTCQLSRTLKNTYYLFNHREKLKEFQVKEKL